MCRASLYILAYLLVVCCVKLVVLSENEIYPIVQCFTTKGPLSIEVYKDWAPLGAARFLELVKDGFYTNIAFFRCVDRFLTQFGISDNPEKKHWHRNQIPDDPNKHLGIKKYYVSFAGGGANTRSTQIFIAFEDLDFLGKEPWETPFGKVVVGEDTLDALYKEYGDIPPFGEGPDQQEIFRQGNAYVREFYPNIDFLHSCSLLEDVNPDDTVVDAAEEEEEEARNAAGLDQAMNDDALVVEGGHELTAEDVDHAMAEEREEGFLQDGSGNYKKSNNELKQHRLRKAKLLRGKGILDGQLFLEDLHAAPEEAKRRKEALVFRAIFFLLMGLSILYFVISRYGSRGGDAGGKAN